MHAFQKMAKPISILAVILLLLMSALYQPAAAAMVGLGRRNYRQSDFRFRRKSDNPYHHRPAGLDTRMFLPVLHKGSEELEGNFRPA